MRRGSATRGTFDESAGPKRQLVEPPAAADQHGVRPGHTLGRYVVIEEIGRLDTGRLLRAYDSKLQREVALKEVHPGVLGMRDAHRLVSEARATARLSHPNVVAVYDVLEPEPSQRSASETAAPAGPTPEHSTPVVVVMEYVAGQTLSAWLCEPRGWQDVVRRFVAAGRGLAAAHDAGLLHGDFKPSNVLVASDASVKITNFGLATVSHHPLSSDGLVDRDDRLHTTGAVVGTPRYMAPEQHDDRPLTPAADQYAFCVALWEALCAAPPFQGEHLTAKKKEGPPPWRQPAVPRRIAEAVRRGLSPDPAERWPDVAVLLEALSYDPTRRRNRWMIATGAVAGISAAATGWRAWATERADRCSGADEHFAGIWDPQQRAASQEAFARTGASRASVVWERTAAELDAYVSRWKAMHTEACEATTVRGEQSSKMMDLRMGCLHRAKVELAEISEVLVNADAALLDHAHELTSGLPSLSRCEDTEALAAEVEPPRPEEREQVDEIRALLAGVKVARNAGRYDEARAKVEAAATAAARVEYGPIETELRYQEGMVYNSLGDYQRAEAAFRTALRLAPRWRQTEWLQRAAGKLMFVVGFQQHRPDEGLRYRELAEALAPGDIWREAQMRDDLGSVLSARGDFAQAEVQHRRALELLDSVEGASAHTRSLYLNNLGTSLLGQDKLDEARQTLERSLEIQIEVMGADHPDNDRVRGNLAGISYAQGNYAEAEDMVRALLRRSRKASGPEHPDVTRLEKNLGMVLRAQHKYAEAESLYRTLVARVERLTPDDPQVVALRHSLALTLVARDRPAEAVLALEPALARLGRVDDAPAKRAEIEFLLARALWQSDPDRRARARELAQGALENYTAAPDDHARELQSVEAWLAEHSSAPR